MSKKARPAKNVKGSEDFLASLKLLDESSGEHNAVEEALSLLKADAASGTSIQKDRWPRKYVRKYGINNLYKYDLPSGRRLTYTILGEVDCCSVVVLDYFRTHKEYEEFFGY